MSQCFSVMQTWARFKISRIAQEYSLAASVKAAREGCGGGGAVDVALLVMHMQFARS